jgi:hypothetical protein
LRQLRWIRRKAFKNVSHFRELASLKEFGKETGEIRLTAAIVGQSEKLGHHSAGLFFWPPLQQSLKGVAVGVAWKEAITIDEVQERHRLAAERADDVMIVDDLIVLAVGMSAAAWQRHQGVPPLF